MTPALPPIAATRPGATPYERTATGPQTSVLVRSPAMGETLSLTLNARDGSVLATGREGNAVQLQPGTMVADELITDLQPGDVLMVKVLATTPRLELARIGMSAPAPTHTGEGPLASAVPLLAAMQPDQAAILRMAWAAPDAATLAAHWQVGVLEHLKKIFGAGAEPTQAPLSPIERWLFPVFAWGGLPMALHLLPPSGRQGSAARRRPRAWGLRLSGVLPSLGLVEVQVQLLSEGAVVLIVVPDETALHRVRHSLPTVTQAVHRAGMRLLNCQWLQRLPAESVRSDPTTASDAPSAGPPWGQAALPSPVFRVAAEVLVALGSLGPPGGISPISPAYR